MQLSRSIYVDSERLARQLMLLDWVVSLRASSGRRKMRLVKGRSFLSVEFSRTVRKLKVDLLGLARGLMLTFLRPRRQVQCTVSFRVSSSYPNGAGDVYR